MKLTKPPPSLKPLLWSLRWKDIDVKNDREDIIVNVSNDGTLEQWHWLVKTYGKETIRRILGNRLETELYPESRRLAQAVFGVSRFRHARKRAH